MRANADLALVGRRVVLVPYAARYVETYHRWMQDAALLEATASEKLTLEEERENQRSWQTDETKLTFIVLDRAACFRDAGDRFPEAAMAGDVNAFLKGDDLGAEVDTCSRNGAKRQKGSKTEPTFYRKSMQQPIPTKL